MLFSEILGQDKIKSKLINAVNEGRISHAQLFLGPSGSGKLALALAYTQYINCSNRKADDSCGVCPSCVKITKLIHPDLHFIFPVASTKSVTDPQSKDFINIWREFLLQHNAYVNLQSWLSTMGIENKQAYIRDKDCNEIIKTLSITSYEGKYKIMIIWMAERFYHTGAPKILKILEEPPEKTLFILIAEQQEELLATIKSRTQLVKILRIDDNTLLQALIEKHNCDKNKAKQIVFLADGDYAKAISLIDSSEEMEGLFNTFREWMLECYFNKFIKLNNFVSKIAKLGREEIINLLRYGLKIIKDCLSVHYGLHNQVRADGQQLDSIIKLSKFINTNNITYFEEEFNKAIFHIERNGNAKVILLDLSLSITQLMRK